MDTSNNDNQNPFLDIVVKMGDGLMSLLQRVGLNEKEAISAIEKLDQKQLLDGSAIQGVKKTDDGNVVVFQNTGVTNSNGESIVRINKEAVDTLKEAVKEDWAQKSPTEVAGLARELRESITAELSLPDGSNPNDLPYRDVTNLSNSNFVGSGMAPQLPNVTDADRIRQEKLDEIAGYDNQNPTNDSFNNQPRREDPPLPPPTQASSPAPTTASANVVVGDNRTQINGQDYTPRKNISIGENNVQISNTSGEESIQVNNGPRSNPAFDDANPTNVGQSAGQEPLVSTDPATWTDEMWQKVKLDTMASIPEGQHSAMLPTPAGGDSGQYITKDGNVFTPTDENGNKYIDQQEAWMLEKAAQSVGANQAGVALKNPDGSDTGLMVNNGGYTYQAIDANNNNVEDHQEHIDWFNSLTDAQKASYQQTGSIDGAAAVAGAPASDNTTDSGAGSASSSTNEDADYAWQVHLKKVEGMERVKAAGMETGGLPYDNPDGTPSGEYITANGVTFKPTFMPDGGVLENLSWDQQVAYKQSLSDPWASASEGELAAMNTPTVANPSEFTDPEGISAGTTPATSPNVFSEDPTSQVGSTNPATGERWTVGEWADRNGMNGPDINEGIMVEPGGPLDQVAPYGQNDAYLDPAPTSASRDFAADAVQSAIEAAGSYATANPAQYNREAYDAAVTSIAQDIANSGGNTKQWVEANQDRFNAAVDQLEGFEEKADIRGRMGNAEMAKDAIDQTLQGMGYFDGTKYGYSSQEVEAPAAAEPAASDPAADYAWQVHLKKVEGMERVKAAGMETGGLSYDNPDGTPSGEYITANGVTFKPTFLPNGQVLENMTWDQQEQYRQTSSNNAWESADAGTYGIAPPEQDNYLAQLEQKKLEAMQKVKDAGMATGGLSYDNPDGTPSGEYITANGVTFKPTFLPNGQVLENMTWDQQEQYRQTSSNNAWESADAGTYGIAPPEQDNYLAQLEQKKLEAMQRVKDAGMATGGLPYDNPDGSPSGEYITAAGVTFRPTFMANGGVLENLPWDQQEAYRQGNANAWAGEMGGMETPTVANNGNMYYDTTDWVAAAGDGSGMPL